MKNIHILPTDKPSRLYKNISEELSFTSIEFTQQKNGFNINQHIYITSDEEIKRGDWYLNNGNLLKCNEVKKRSSCKKIILTTDIKLAPDVQMIDDEFLEWFVKHPTCEFVEVEFKTKQLVKPYDVYNEQVSYYKIIVPKEELKQETLEEAADKYFPFAEKIGGETYTAYKGFMTGAKWQAERMYSEEDMITFANWVFLEVGSNTSKDRTNKELFNEWFEQFKKK